MWLFLGDKRVALLSVSEVYGLCLSHVIPALHTAKI